MEVNYKLDKIKELAAGDEGFVVAIASAFLEEVPEAVIQMGKGLAEKDFQKVYQNAHKIKPTIQLFDIPVYNDVIVLQDWGKFEQEEKNVLPTFERVSIVVKNVVTELKSDFKL